MNRYDMLNRWRGKITIHMFVVSAIMAGGFLIGCSLNAQGEKEVAAAWEKHQQKQVEDAAGYAEIPDKRVSDTAPADTQPSAEFETPASLRDYIIEALKNNPDIKTAEELARAKAARIPQLTALPDPILMTKILPEPVRTAEGDNFFILGVNQKLPVPGKLDRAGRIALEETRMALAQWQQVRLRVIGDVKRAYFQLYIIDRTSKVTHDNQDLLKVLIDTARAQVAAGKRRQEDILRAQVELSNLESQLIELRQKRQSATAMLNSLLDRRPTAEIPPPAPFDIRQVDMQLEKLFTLAFENNPALKHFEMQIERDKQAVALARLAYWPDFTLGFEWISMKPRDAFRPPINPQTGRRPVVSRMSEEGTDNWAINFGFNLPIWFEKIEAGIREQKRKLSASMHQYTAEKNRVYFQIEDVLTRIRAQQELAELFDSTIIPQAKQAYEVSRTGYVVGRSDFQYVIDNWQKWLVFTIQYHRAIGELERSVADLEQIIGLSLVEADTTGSMTE